MKIAKSSNWHFLPFTLLKGMFVPIYFFLFVTSAEALPGDSASQVAAWVNAHPTLRPGIGEHQRHAGRLDRFIYVRQGIGAAVT